METKRQNVEEFLERDSRANLGGGQDKIDKQHEAGKMTSLSAVALSAVPMPIKL
jgi:acetyl-CoA carboxylase carboxyltransferase component